MKKIIKILDIVVYITYALIFASNICAMIQTKNMAYAGTCIWIINAGTMYSLFRHQSKFGDERVKWRDETIEKLFKFNKEMMQELDEIVKQMEDEAERIGKIGVDRQFCIYYKNKTPEIIYWPRNLHVGKFEKIEKSKEIASKIIGCEYVDGRNLEIDGQYVAGVYIDDLETMTQRHEMVIINEVDGLDRATCEKIIKYLKEDNEFTAELKKYELI